MKWMFFKGQSANVVTAEDTATKTTAGVVKMAAKVAEAAGANVTKAEFKALLDALKAAGLMSST